MKPLAKRWIFRLMLSLVVTLSVTIVPLVIYHAQIQRWVQLRQIRSPDPQTRAKGRAYIATRTAGDPVLRDMVARLLGDADEPTFEAAVEALIAAGLWGPDFRDGWVRMMTGPADQLNVEGRIFRAVELYSILWKHPDLSRDPRMIVGCTRLMQDAEANVRYNALYASGLLRGPQRVKLLGMAAQDKQPAIAMQAWMMIGLLGDEASSIPLPDSPAKLPIGTRKTADGKTLPDVRLARAILWAAGKRGGAAAELPLAVLRDPQANSDLRAMAVYALAGHPQAQVEMAKLIENCPTSGLLADALPGWRAILAIDLQAGKEPIRRFTEKAEALGVEAEALGAAATYRIWPTLMPAGKSGPELAAMLWSGKPERMLRDLARLESLPDGSLDIPLNLNWPPISHLQACRIAQKAGPEDFMKAFDHDDPTVRDLACVLALRKLKPAEFEDLAYRLIFSFSHNQRAAGAVAAGLSSRTDKLAKAIDVRLRFPDEWPWVVLQHYDMALEMWKPDSSMDRVVSHLTNTVMPNSTVILALTAKGRLSGLDHLLNPIGEAERHVTEKPEPMGVLLDQRRYWMVLRHFAPDLPDFWVWGDPILQQFQVDVIRNWYLLRRHDLKFDPQAGQFRIGA